MRQVVLVMLLMGARAAWADEAPGAPADGAGPADAPADDGADQNAAKLTAKQLIGEGDQKFASGDAEGALAKYLAAHEAYPSPKIYYPLAKAEEKLGRLAAALSHYEQFLAGAGKDVHKDVIKTVTRAIAKLRPKVAAMTIEVDVDDATVTVDGRPVGTTPLDKPVYVDPGKRVFEAQAEGRAPAHVEVEVTAGEQGGVKLTLPPAVVMPPKVVIAPPQLAVVHPPPPPEKPRRRSHLGFWVGLSLTAGFSLTATVTGVMALGKHSEFEDTSKTLAQRKSARSSGQTLAAVTDVMLLGAVASGVYTTWYYLAKMRGGESGGAAVAGAVGPALVPAIGVNTLGIAGHY